MDQWASIIDYLLLAVVASRLSPIPPAIPSLDPSLASRCYFKFIPRQLPLLRQHSPPTAIAPTSSPPLLSLNPGLVGRSPPLLRASDFVRLLTCSAFLGSVPRLSSLLRHYLPALRCSDLSLAGRRYFDINPPQLSFLDSSPAGHQHHPPPVAAYRYPDVVSYLYGFVFLRSEPLLQNRLDICSGICYRSLDMLSLVVELL